ncbi:MAG TPA: cobalamin-binding protein [Candidatus Acidoferrales bacterium]|nr:cobalamin-binding protein [Candidatus Acidoferrales bacterium]
MRVCSLLPSATEIAFALGLGDEVVGVTHECDYPPQAKGKPVIVHSAVDSSRLSSSEIDHQVAELLRAGKNLYTIDDEAFTAAAPDVILTQGLCEVCALDYNDVVKASRRLPGKPTIVSLIPHCLADVLDDIVRVGAATQRHREAETLVLKLKRRIEEVRDCAKHPSSFPRVACIEWFDPIYAAGHWVPEMVNLAGGNDGLGLKNEPSAKILWAEVREFQPEILVLMPCGFDVQRATQESKLLEKLEGWNEIPAVKAGNVFAVNGHAYFSRPGPRLVDGLEILAQIVHPEIFPWNPPPGAVHRMFRPRR